MADLITKLLLNTQQFDNNLGKSTKQIKEFQKKIDNFASDAKKSLVKFAGTVGIAVTALEGLEKIIRSNQTTSDLFDNNINAAKGSVDAFFRSLTTGDWTVFNDGIMTAFSRLYDLSALMDELADKKLSLSYIKAADLQEIEHYESIAKDTNRSLKERKEAAENMATAIKHLSKETADYIRDSEELLTSTYKANYGINVSREDLDYFFRRTNKSEQEVIEKIDKYKKERAALVKKYTYTTTMPTTAGSFSTSVITKEGKEALSLYDKQNEFIRTQAILLDEVDEKRKATLDILKEHYDMQREIYGLQKRSDETGRAVNTSIATSGTKNKVIPVGSVAELQSKLAGLKKGYENATSEGVRAGFTKAIKEAETELKMMQLRAAGTSLLPTGEINKPVGRNIADDLKTGYIKNPIAIDSIQANYDYADSLGAIASVMSSVTNMTNEGAAGWLAYGANIFSSISAAIPMITSLTTALTAKAAAEAAGSAAVVPVVGWVNAIAAVTAITAAMASIPKFATGGIVGGTSFTGDNMLARVNSGEMILNRSQQKNLFNLINGGTSNTVKFRIEGKELVGVLNAYGSKTSKYK